MHLAGIISTVGGAALVVSVSVATPTLAWGAEKYPLVGPAANISCANLTPAGENVSKVAPGFVIFNLNRHGILSAVVSLKGAPPHTRFPLRLIQGGAGDCYKVDGVLVTDGQGKGTLRLTERDVANRAQIIIDTKALFKKPTYRGTHFFVTR
jgi:hypothetical protein